MLGDLLCGNDVRAEASLAHLTPDDLPQLVELARSPSAETRWWAIRALGAIQISEAVPPLILALADPDQSVQGIAIAVLGMRREPSAASVLVPHLNHPSSFIAQLACDSLEQIGLPAVPFLIAALSDGSPQTRRLAARALARIKDPSSIAALFKALDDDSMYVQHWAEEGLEAMGVGQVYFKP
jgi:HEAT repeat protein